MLTRLAVSIRLVEPHLLKGEKRLGCFGYSLICLSLIYVCVYILPLCFLLKWLLEWESPVDPWVDKSVFQSLPVPKLMKLPLRTADHWYSFIMARNIFWRNWDLTLKYTKTSRERWWSGWNILSAPDAFEIIESLCVSAWSRVHCVPGTEFILTPWLWPTLSLVGGAQWNRPAILLPRTQIRF